MASIDENDIIRCKVTLRSPIAVESLPLLSRLDRAARRKRRGIWKRVIGKPARQLFRKMAAGNMNAMGRMRIETANGPKRIAFNARNTQFSALYMPDYKPFYEAELCTIFDRLVGTKDTFFDIGANWGWHSIVVATRPQFAGSVHAFEPFPSSYADLTSVVKDADLGNCIECYDIALADSDGSSGMAIPGGLHSGGAQLGQGSDIQVRLAKLDSLDLPMPKAMKVDVEDHEIGVLQGGKNLIEKARPFIVFENWAHRDDPATTFAPLQFLTRAGYALYYPGWIAGDQDCIVSSYAGSDQLALVPFLPAHRYQLGDLINIVAVAGERIAEFRSAFG